MTGVSRETDLQRRADDLEARIRREHPAVKITAMQLVDAAGAAVILDCSKRTLERMREDGTGPAALIIHRRLYFALGTLVAWIDSKTADR